MKRWPVGALNMKLPGNSHLVHHSNDNEERNSLPATERQPADILKSGFSCFGSLNANPSGDFDLVHHPPLKLFEHFFLSGKELIERNSTLAAPTILAQLRAAGIEAHLEGNDLRLKAPQGVLTPQLVEQIRQHKNQIQNIFTEEQLGGALNTIFQSNTDPVCHSRSTDSDPEVSPSFATSGVLNQNTSANIDLVRHGSRLLLKFGDERLPFLIWDGQKLAGTRIGIDTETSPIQSHTVPNLVLASVSDGHQHFVLPRRSVANFLKLHRECKFVAHNMAFDHWVLVKGLGDDAHIWWEIADANRLYCTDLLEQLILLAVFDQPPRGRSLDELAQQHLNVELFGKDDPRRLQFDTIRDQPLSDVDPWFLEYAVQDAVAAIKIHEKQRSVAKRHQPASDQLLPGATKKYGFLSEKVQVRGAIALELIHRNGMHLDADRVPVAQAAIRAQLFEQAEQLHERAPGIIQRYKQERFVDDNNRGFKLVKDSDYPAKQQTVARELFQSVAKAHKLRIPKTSRGEVSLSKHDWANHRHRSPIVDAYLDYCDLGKTYGFFRQLNGEHLHPTYRRIVRSGRVSCSSPNVQQVPRKGGVREMFVPSPGYHLFAIDYAALELRTLAAICLKKYGHSKLAEVINSGIDPHAYSYCQIHDMTMDEFASWKKEDPAAAKAARDAIKGVTFGVPGSMQAAGLVSYVRKSYGQTITEETARQYRHKLIEEVYPEWSLYLAQTGNSVYTLTGRVRGRIERSGQLFNSQFQGLAGDGAKEALWRLMRAGFRLVGFIHDEFLIELPADQDNTKIAMQIEQICCETMEEFTPGVKIATEYTLSDRWSKDAEAVFREGRLEVWTPGGK